MGGGVMRTAAKAAVLGGYRSAGPFAEAAASRRAACGLSVTVPPASSAGESGLSTALCSSETGRADAPLVAGIQRPAWEFDEWEFAGGKEEELFDALHPTPRLVFGPVPTLEEAKEATSDLKDAIEKVYFSANSAEESVKSGQGSTSSESSAILPVVPKHVVQAFTLLQGSPEAQNVVAALASDKNVWDAVMKNEKVVEFYKAHEYVVPPPPGINLDPEESVADNVNAEESVESSETPNEETSESSGLFDWVHNMKQRVSEIVSNISDLLQDFIGVPMGEATTKASTRTGTADSYVEVAIGASFLALAVAAILVVLLKRGD